jgi:hypothetical protein
MYELSRVRRFVLSRHFARIWALVVCAGLAPSVFGQMFVELGRTAYQGNDYLLIALAPTMPGGTPTPMDPFQARLGATEFGGWLMTVANRAEEVAVVEALRGFRTVGPWGSADFWAGLSDTVEEGVFVWDNGEPVTYTNWAPGEPNNCCAGEDHMEIWTLDDDADPEYITWNDEGSASNDNFAVVEMPGTPPPLVLQIDPTTGYGRFRTTIDSADILSVTLNAYELLPESTPFDVGAWSASNLSARGVDAIDPNAEGMRWETLNASSNQLLEAYLLGGSDFSEGEFLVIGKVFPNGSGEAPLTINYTVNINFTDPGRPDSENTLYEDALVEYVQFDVGVTGDYNGDGTVNAADYTVWRNTRNGTGPGLAADGNNDNVVNQLDYDVWKANFGSSGLGLALEFAAVPEPGVVGLFVIALAGYFAIERRNGRATHRSRSATLPRISHKKSGEFC